MKYTEIKILIKKSNSRVPFYTMYNKIFKKLYQHEKTKKHMNLIKKKNQF